MPSQDFQQLWEARFIEVLLPYLDPAPAVSGAGRVAEFEDGSTMTVEVEPGENIPPRSGIFRCNVAVYYDFRDMKETEDVSKVWGQTLEALGNGRTGDDPLRNRLSSGRAQVANGIDAVMYDQGFSSGEDFKVFEFTAYLQEKVDPSLN